MNPKTFLITFTIIIVIISVTTGALLDLRARRARTVPPANAPHVTAPITSGDSYLPSREYIEARAKAFKQVREEQLKAQFSDINANTRK